jgi:FkbM family methyltransferase
MTQRNIILSLAEDIARILPLSFKRSLYQNPSLSSLLRSTLNRVVPEGLSEVEISAENMVGLRMNLDLQSEKDYWLGTYEPELQAAIQDLTKPGQIIYDLGANIGFISLLFASRTGSNGRIYSFEALPENVTRLQDNIELNGFQDRVTIIHSAVQDHSGQANFLIGPSHGTGKVDGSVGRSTLDYQAQIEIQGLSIDDFVYHYASRVPDIIKIDIEGGEVLALSGMQRLLKEHNPILFLELHGPDAAQTCWELLSKEKYRICKMTSDYAQVSDLAELDWKSYIVAFPVGYAK